MTCLLCSFTLRFPMMTERWNKHPNQFLILTYPAICPFNMFKIVGTQNYWRGWADLGLRLGDCARWKTVQVKMLMFIFFWKEKIWFVSIISKCSLFQPIMGKRSAQTVPTNIIHIPGKTHLSTLKICQKYTPHSTYTRLSTGWVWLEVVCTLKCSIFCCYLGWWFGAKKKHEKPVLNSKNTYLYVLWFDIVWHNSYLLTILVHIARPNGLRWRSKM